MIGPLISIVIVGAAKAVPVIPVIVRLIIIVATIEIILEVIVRHFAILRVVVQPGHIDPSSLRRRPEVPTPAARQIF